MRPPFAALLLLTLGALALSGCGTGRIALVDSARILNESVRALFYQKQLDEREKAMALDLQLLRGRLSPADLEARRNQYLRELQQMKRELEDRLNKEIRDVAGQIAREKGLRSAVIVKTPVIFSGPGRAIDITDEVIARLR
jgi:Skp family chaperone for outer membrane proteins